MGVFEANIGGGTVIQGSLNNVFWGEHAYFIRVELNPQPTGGNFILMGTSQLLSVPVYALSLQKGSGSFKIDHPLDPENKYLYHSFVESPDMMNVYNGNVTTDANGLATVELPDYFEALNRDFRYQLTTIGGFAQLTVEREVANNTFTIRSDKPNVKVSWQVTGIRQDAHANKFRIVPTVEKEAKYKGKYLCPECFHQPEEKGIFYEDLHSRDSKQN